MPAGEHDNSIGIGQRTGPGFEGARCPACGGRLRIRSGASEEIECACGKRFFPDSLADISTRNPAKEDAVHATLLVHGSSAAAVCATLVEEPIESPGGADPGPDPRIAAAGADRSPRLGKYEIIGEIARGGMGVVYKARQIGMKREVALKMLLAGEGASEEQVRRFLREAESAGKLSHPGIVPIFDVGSEGGKHYYAMEFIQGESLSSVIDRMGLIPPRLALKIARDAASALHYAHERGIVHRDVKPGNIMITPVGTRPVMENRRGFETVAFASGHSAAFRVVLTDFGLAKDMTGAKGLTVSGAALGTPVYMPPEQADGDLKSIGPRSDVYSLGAVLYEMVTGVEPFSGESVAQVLAKVMTTDPVAPSRVVRGLHRDVETIILKAMAKESGRRYASAAEFAEDADRYLRGETLKARRAGLIYRARKMIARNRPAAAGVSVVLAAAMLAGAFYFERVSSKALKVAAEAQAREAEGWTLYGRGDLDEAEKEFRAAAAIRPEGAGSQAGLRNVRLKRLLASAELLLKSGNFEAASALLDEASIIDPANLDTQRLSRTAAGTAEISAGPGCGGLAMLLAPVSSGLVLTDEACPPAGALAGSGFATGLAVAPFSPRDVAFGQYWLMAVGPGTRWCRLASLPRNGAIEVDFGECRVGSSPSADFATLREAIAAARPGWTIIVEPGEYREEVWVTKPFLTIKAEQGPEKPALVGGEGSTVNVVKACGTRIEGLRIVGGKQHAVSASDSPGFMLVGCTIEGAGREAVNVGSSPMALLIANEVSGCLEAGMVLRDSRHGIVAGNRIRKVGWSGILLSGDESTAARNLCEETMRIGIFLNRSRGARIVENVCRRNPQWGVAVVEETEDTIVEGNLAADIRFPDNTQIGRGIQFGISKNGIMRGNTIWRCDVGMMFSNAPGCSATGNIVDDCKVAIWLESGAGSIEGNFLFGKGLVARVNNINAGSLPEALDLISTAGFAPMSLGLWADPRLADPEGGDFSLLEGSPAIGAAFGGEDAGADRKVINDVSAGRFDRVGWLKGWNAAAAARASAKAAAAGNASEAASMMKIALAMAGTDESAIRAVEKIRSELGAGMKMD